MRYRTRKNSKFTRVNKVRRPEFAKRMNIRPSGTHRELTLEGKAKRQWQAGIITQLTKQGIRDERVTMMERLRNASGYMAAKKLYGEAMKKAEPYLPTWAAGVTSSADYVMPAVAVWAADHYLNDGGVRKWVHEKATDLSTPKNWEGAGDIFKGMSKRSEYSTTGSRTDSVKPPDPVEKINKILERSIPKPAPKAIPKPSAPFWFNAKATGSRKTAEEYDPLKQYFSGVDKPITVNINPIQNSLIKSSIRKGKPFERSDDVLKFAYKALEIAQPKQMEDEAHRILYGVPNKPQLPGNQPQIMPPQKAEPVVVPRPQLPINPRPHLPVQIVGGGKREDWIDNNYRMKSYNEEVQSNPVSSLLDYYVNGPEDDSYYVAPRKDEL